MIISKEHNTKTKDSMLINFLITNLDKTNYLQKLLLNSPNQN